MKRLIPILFIIGAICWTGCGSDDSNLLSPEPEKPIYPDLSNLKIDEVIRNEKLYVKFNYDNAGRLKVMDYYNDEGRVNHSIDFEYDEHSRLVTFSQTYLSGCCEQGNYEVSYKEDGLVEIKRLPGERPQYSITEYLFDQDRLMSITGYAYDEHGGPHLQSQTDYFYDDNDLYQVNYQRNGSLRIYDAQFDDRINPFHGIPSVIIGDVFPGLEYVPSNLLSLVGEYGTAILNNFSYNQDGYPTEVEVTTDNLLMKITYVE